MASKAKDYSLSLFHEEPKDTHAIGLTPEVYKRIAQLARNRRAGKLLTDKYGRRTRFYFHEGNLFGRIYLPDGTHTTQPVFDISNIPEQTTRYNQIKESVRDKIRKDFPDYTPEQVEAYADIIEEGSMAVRRLVSSGMSVATAHNIVFSSLNRDNIDTAFVERWLTENASLNSTESLPPQNSA